MDDQQNAPLAAVFPAPPPYWQSFTASNLERIAELRGAQKTSAKNYDASKELPLKILDLPAELRWLEPPVPPAEGTYKCFGDSFDLADRLPSLTEMGVEQLYTPPRSPTPNGVERHTDRAFILKKIVKSMLLNFLELVGIMDISVDQYVEKNDDLNTLFMNFHHLLNEYRPHQARESLILMMENQLDRICDETRANNDITAKAERMLKGLGQAKLADQTESDTKPIEPMDGKDIWDELDREFD